MSAPRRPSRTGHRRDRWLLGVCTAAATLAGVIALLVVGFLVVEAAPLLVRHGPLAFFTDERWVPRDGQYGLLPMVAGSVVVVVGAVALSTPLGIGAALASALFAGPRLSRLLRAALAVLAGVPSVIYGFWGLTVVVPLINRVQAPGVSVLAGVLVLALMILPTMALLADAALRAVPAAFLQQGAALGLSPTAVALHVALPAARRGLVAASVLQVGRALGETMAVIMVMGNAIQVPGSVFDPARALTAHIALEMAYALGDHRRGLFVSGLLLMTVVAALLLLAGRLRTAAALPA